MGASRGRCFPRQPNGKDFSVDVRLLDSQDAAEFVRPRLEVLTREPNAFARTPETRSRGPLTAYPSNCARCRRAISWLEPSPGRR